MSNSFKKASAIFSVIFAMVLHVYAVSKEEEALRATLGAHRELLEWLFSNSIRYFAYYMSLQKLQVNLGEWIGLISS